MIPNLITVRRIAQINDSVPVQFTRSVRFPKYDLMALFKHESIHNDLAHLIQMSVIGRKLTADVTAIAIGSCTKLENTPIINKAKVLN